MGNAPSSAPRRRGDGATKQRWTWEYRNGRYQPKPVAAAAAAAKPKLKWAKRPSNNYDWWIFNPDRKNNSDSNDEWPFFGRKKAAAVRRGGRPGAA